jgi:KTSC domain
MRKFILLIRLLLLGSVTFIIQSSSFANDQIVEVKYRGRVSLAPFDCNQTSGSSFIQEVCYDQKKSYMLMNLGGSWYHYCAIGPGTVSDLLKASSMGQFYNEQIKGSFDCRTNPPPQY